MSLANKLAEERRARLAAERLLELKIRHLVVAVLLGFLSHLVGGDLVFGSLRLLNHLGVK